MATSNQMRALNRLPYDFIDGLKINGVDVTGLNQYATPGGAATIGFTPVGNIAAGNVQAALAELDSEKVGFARLDDTDGSSLVGYDGGTVQDVLDGAKSLQDYAALRAYTGRATRIYITGLLVTVKPAGIAGPFQHDPTDTTSLDNDGTIIVLADGRRFKRDFDGPVSVKWFGAKGDCIGLDGTDDTEAIQKAVNFVQSYNGELHSPAGVYKTTDSIKITNPNGITFIGDGPGATIFRLFDATNTKSVITTGTSGVGGSAVDKLIIRQLRVEAANPFTGKHGIELTNCHHWVLDNVQAWNMKNDGLHLDESYIGNAVGCHFAGNQGWGVWWGSTSRGANFSSHNVALSSCEVQGNKTGGIFIDGPTAPVVQNCAIEANTNVGIDLVFAKAPSITGNYFEQNDAFGIRVGNTAQIVVGGVITGNSIEQNSVAGLYVNNAYSLDIFGNFFSATTVAIRATANANYCLFGVNHKGSLPNDIAAVNSYVFDLDTLRIPKLAADTVTTTQLTSSQITATTVVTSGKYNTASGMVSGVAPSTPTTMFTMPDTGVYQVYAYVANSDDTANFAAYAVILKDRNSRRIAISQNAALLSISVSSDNVLVTQSNAAAVNITWVYHKISA